MKTNATLSLLLILLTASLFYFKFNATSATASTIEVPPYPTIQEAINAANPGDTIKVYAGTYHENVIINKTLTLIGAGKNYTFIQGDKESIVVTIMANNVNLSGFTIQGGISGVSISNYNASTINNNTIISNSNQGIYLQLSHNNLIANNTISMNEFEGIFLQNSTNNLINNNIVTQNTYVGIDLLFANNNRISNNTISYHKNVTLHNQGVWMESSNNNTIDGNLISSNAYGIDMYTSDNNTIVGNTISGSHYGIAIYRSENNTAHHNDFLYNTHQVDSSQSSNKWDNDTEGNYWSDYTGTDSNNDGIGDMPYAISGDNPDRFPLMKPWNPINDTTPPNTTNDYDGLWHTTDFTINLMAFDDISGVKATYYRINDGPTIYSVSANGQPIINTEAANNALEYWSVDGVDNEETPHRILTDIKLDKTLPEGSIQINNGDTYTTSPSVTLNLSVTDFTSGIAQMRFSNDGAFWALWKEYNTPEVWNLTLGDGLKTVYVQFRDNASLVSQLYNDAIILDTTPPMISILSPSEGSEIKSSEVTIQWIGTDAGVGIDHYEIRMDSNSWINTGANQEYVFAGLTDGTHTAYIKAVDNIGQASEASVSFVVNTSPIGGVGYLEEAVLILIPAVVIGAIVYTLKVRKNRRLKRESDRSAGPRAINTFFLVQHIA